MEHAKLVLVMQLTNVIHVIMMVLMIIFFNMEQHNVFRIVQMVSSKIPLHLNAKFVILIAKLV